MKNAVITVIVTILTIVAVWIFYGRCNPPAPPEVDYIPDSTQYWKNSAGQLVASLKQLESDFEKSEKGWKDSLAKMHNTTAKKIQAALTAYIRGQASITDPGKPEIVYYPVHDSSQKCPPEIKSISKIFVSPYYVATATLYPGEQKSTLDLITYDSISIVVKKVTEGRLFNKNTFLQLDIKNANPYNMVSGIKAYKIPAVKPKRIGIGLQAGYGVGQNLQLQPFIGLGVSYNIIRL